VKPIQALAAVFAVAACSFAQHAFSGSSHAAISHAQPAVRAQAAPPATSGTHIVNPSAGVTFPATGVAPGTVYPTTPAKAYYGGRNPNRRYGANGAVPYYFAYPVIVGGGYDNGYSVYPDPAYADNGGAYATDPPPPPQVITNQNYVPERANPVMRDYTGESSGVQVYDAPGREAASNANDDGTDYYLIAFKDHSIYSAFAYWVDGDTLHYVTPQRVHNQVSLALVDRDLTNKLNRGRMQVTLPN